MVKYDFISPDNPIMAQLHNDWIRLQERLIDALGMKRGSKIKTRFGNDEDRQNWIKDWGSDAGEIIEINLWSGPLNPDGGGDVLVEFPYGRKSFSVYEVDKYLIVLKEEKQQGTEEETPDLDKETVKFFIDDMRRRAVGEATFLAYAFKQIADEWEREYDKK